MVKVINNTVILVDIQPSVVHCTWYIARKFLLFNLLNLCLFVYFIIHSSRTKVFCNYRVDRAIHHKVLSIWLLRPPLKLLSRYNIQKSNICFYPFTLV